MLEGIPAEACGLREEFHVALFTAWLARCAWFGKTCGQACGYLGREGDRVPSREKDCSPA
jgi:hypothetical protein